MNLNKILNLFKFILLIHDQIISTGYMNSTEFRDICTHSARKKCLLESNFFLKTFILGGIYIQEANTQAAELFWILHIPIYSEGVLNCVNLSLVHKKVYPLVMKILILLVCYFMDIHQQLHFCLPRAAEGRSREIIKRRPYVRP